MRTRGRNGIRLNCPIAILKIWINRCPCVHHGSKLIRSFNEKALSCDQSKMSNLANKKKSVSKNKHTKRHTKPSEKNTPQPFHGRFHRLMVAIEIAGDAILWTLDEVIVAQALIWGENRWDRCTADFPTTKMATVISHFKNDFSIKKGTVPSNLLQTKQLKRFKDSTWIDWVIDSDTVDFFQSGRTLQTPKKIGVLEVRDMRTCFKPASSSLRVSNRKHSNSAPGITIKTSSLREASSCRHSEQNINNGFKQTCASSKKSRCVFSGLLP